MRGLGYLPVVALADYALGPLLVLAANALKSDVELTENRFGPPATARWQNFAEAWAVGHFGVTLANSAWLVLLVVPAVLVVSFPAAWVLARWRSRRADAVVVGLLVASTIPIQLYLIPLFVFCSRAGLLDSLPVLALVYVAKFSPLPTFLLRAFLLETPVEIEEAARIDGAGDARLLSSVLIPICRPVLLTAALITGLLVWNEFALAVTFIQDASLKPVSTSLFAFRQEHVTDWPLTDTGARKGVFTAYVP